MPSPVVVILLTDKSPLALIDRAAVVEVASPAAVVVAKYKMPPAFLCTHWLKSAPEERESCGAVEDERVSW